jgi:hypothetical protein
VFNYVTNLIGKSTLEQEFGVSASQASTSAFNCHCIGGEVLFSNENYEDNTTAKHIRDEFMNDCIVCFVEQEFLATIQIDDVICFHKMEDRNRTGNL